MVNIHNAAGHPGLNETSRMAEEWAKENPECSWTSRWETARLVTQGCEACLLRKRGKTRPAKDSHTPRPGTLSQAAQGPMDLWRMDHVGPFRIQGIDYEILVCVDAFSRMVFASFVPSTNAADPRLALK